eukprot:m.277517 g.277517  ORF g.277517 m.277517 type:complete len:50 (+) comp19375_c0_seq8:1667-1816(+)
MRLKARQLQVLGCTLWLDKKPERTSPNVWESSGAVIKSPLPPKMAGLDT